MQFAQDFCFVFVFLFFYTLRIMVMKTRAKKTSTPSSFDFQSDRFRFRKNQEDYEKLNVFRPVWVKRRVILDEVNPEIHRNFECRGWLPLLDVEHTPPAALIK